jgi:hypothetical protein
MSKPSTDLDRPRARIEQLSETDRHRLLSSERRRVTLEVLAAAPIPIDVRELAAAVAVRESDGTGDVDRVATALHHCHLPKMRDMGILDYDPETTRVAATR